MKLVGATNWFVKSPYLFQVVIFSFIACSVALLLVYPFVSFIQPFVNEALQTNNIDLVGYFREKALYIFAIQFAITAVFSVFSSNYATRKYLRV